MTIAMIDEILKGNFTDEADRLYWEKKRSELIRKEQTARENEKYFKKNYKYDR